MLFDIERPVSLTLPAFEDQLFESKPTAAMLVFVVPPTLVSDLKLVAVAASEVESGILILIKAPPDEPLPDEAIAS